uniref:Zonadhesin 3-like n=1 Tax=Tineola bisselliella TaxID=93883 RepID=A0A891XHJ7_TINBI|nr:zonadhesin 3-like [Tineola bisselliella]
MNILAVFIFVVTLDWAHGTSSHRCSNKDEVYSNCKELTCETRHQKRNCSSQNYNCVCKSGYVRDGARHCIPKDDCSFCPRDEKYVNCTDGYCRVKTCDQLGYPLECPEVKGECKGGCVCIDGYVRNCAGICIPQSQCPSCGGDENAIAGCGTHCGNSCSDYKLRPVILCPAILCTANPNICLCRDGYVYDESTKKCILPENCPGQECGENEYYDNCKKCCICNDGYKRKNKVCVKKCGKNEHFTNCVNKCPKLPKGAVCRIKCLPGCACDDGYERVNEKCVRKCPKSEHSCKPRNKNCLKDCTCNKGYSRRHGVCTKIKCGKHEHYSPCINPCPNGAQCAAGCIEGCLCNKGYVRKGDVCIKECVAKVEKSNHESSSTSESSEEENSTSSSSNRESENNSKTTITHRHEDSAPGTPSRSSPGPPSGPPPKSDPGKQTH